MRFCAGLFLGLLLLTTNSSGLPSPDTINQLYHSSWTAKDGLRGIVTAITQTSDGFIWLGTTEGLFRFDGISFEAYKPDVGEYPATTVIALCPVPDGLWIGYMSGGVSFLSKGKLKNYSDKDGLPISRIRSIAADKDGTIWVAAIGGMARLEGQRWHKVRLDWNFTARSASVLFVDRDGTLWAPGESKILYLRRGQHKFEDAGFQTASSILAISQAPDGSIWYSQYAGGTSILRFDANGKISTQHVVSGAYGVLVDRDSTVWLVNEGILWPQAQSQLLDKRNKLSLKDMESFDHHAGLSGDSINDILEDKEGNIWVTTNSGLDRFRRRNLRWYATPEEAEYFSLITGDDDELWAAGFGGLIFNTRTGKSIPGSPENVRYVYRDPGGTLWFYNSDGIWTRSKGRFELLSPPDEVEKILPVTKRDPMGLVSITTDNKGRNWFAIGGRGEFVAEDGRWHHVVIRKNHPDWAANASFADHDGRIWLANDAYLATHYNGVSQTYDDKDGPEVGPIKAINELGHDVLIGGELGLAVFHENRFRKIAPQEPGGFGQVTSITVAAGNGVWLTATPGIVHIADDELKSALMHPGYRVRCDVLDVVSDLPAPLSAGLPTGAAVQARDGSLWFAATRGIARVSPQLYRNVMAPPVVIKSLLADERSYSTYEMSRLPALTRIVRFDYTALSLSVPERIRFRYKLEGFDKEWNEPSTERSTSYTNLKPGAYQFRVIASNNDGVWNNVGANLPFVILPAWYQTSWFFFACAIAALSLLWLAYRLRIRQVAKAISERFDERLEERTRIARELHDTLLQTIQATKLIADDVLDKHGNTDETGQSISRVSEWLKQALQEGRAVLYSLRSSTQVSNDLTDRFDKALHDEAAGKGIEVKLQVVGDCKETHPIVSDEIYRVGCEAIRNACLHSSAHRLEVQLEYGRDLIIRVLDDGKGMPAETMAKGRPGHFGLTGMRERARKIGASLQLSSSTEHGTTVMLYVPGAVAFRSEKSRQNGRSSGDA